MIGWFKLWRAWRSARVVVGCDAAGPFFARPKWRAFIKSERERKLQWAAAYAKLSPSGKQCVERLLIAQLEAGAAMRGW